MRATIWIRKENEEAWAALKDKSDFVNKVLGTQTIPPVTLEAKPEVIEAIRAGVKGRLQTGGYMKPQAKFGKDKFK